MKIKSLKSASSVGVASMKTNLDTTMNQKFIEKNATTKDILVVQTAVKRRILKTHTLATMGLIFVLIVLTTTTTIVMVATKLYIETTWYGTTQEEHICVNLATKTIVSLR